MSSLLFILNLLLFLSRVLAGEVVKKAGIKGATSKGEQGLLGAVELAEVTEFGLETRGSVVSAIGDS